MNLGRIDTKQIDEWRQVRRPASRLENVGSVRGPPVAHRGLAEFPIFHQAEDGRNEADTGPHRRCADVAFVVTSYS